MIQKKQFTRREKLWMHFEQKDFVHNVFTPYELCEQMIDMVDVRNKDILVMNPEFALLLIEDFGVTPSRITIYADFDPSIEIIAQRMNINYIDAWNYSMKFDVVFANPPYQDDSTGDAKRWTLWSKFLINAIESSSVVSFICPKSVVAPGKPWNLIRNNLRYINLDSKEHFKVASTFCSFIYDANYDGETEVISEGKSFSLDTKDLPFLPNTIDEENLSLLNKLMNRPRRLWKRGEFHTSAKEYLSDDGINLIHTNAQTLNVNDSWSHDNLNKIRVVVTLSGYPKFQVIQNTYCSQATYWTEFSSVEDAQNFADECNGEFVQKLLSTFKWSGWNSRQVIELL